MSEGRTSWVGGVIGTVQDLSRFGQGVVKTEQGVVFADGVLPGERVELDGVKKAGKVLRADRVRVLDASTQRVQPECPVALRCGGCPLMIASEPLQAKFRRGLLEQAIEGLPGAEDVSFGWFGTPERLQYRVRARMTWSNGSRGLRFGYRNKRSDQIAEVRSCAVLHPTLDRAQGALRRKVREGFAGDGELHLALGAEGKAVLTLVSAEPQPPELYRDLEAMVESGALAGAALYAGGATLPSCFGEPRSVSEGHDGEPVRGSIAGFGQAHAGVNRALVGRVLELVQPAERNVLELFAGSGNFTVMLAKTARSLIAIERDEEAANACRENLTARGLDATVRTEDAETYRHVNAPDVVLLDPPRAGAPKAMRWIVRYKIPEVVYVSCDPPTLRRDLSTLTTAGYRLTDALALDMFPQTAHLESVVRLVR